MTWRNVCAADVCLSAHFLGVSKRHACDLINRAWAPETLKTVPSSFSRQELAETKLRDREAGPNAWPNACRFLRGGSRWAEVPYLKHADVAGRDEGIPAMPPSVQHAFYRAPRRHHVDAIRRCIHALDAKQALVFMNFQQRLRVSL